jgi:hypothetical protein
MPVEGASWETIPVQVAGVEQGIDGRLIANALMVADLVEAIEKDRNPICNQDDGRWTIEMISGIYAAQQTGGRVKLPLRERRHPLDLI